jgi:hypothetical protein
VLTAREQGGRRAVCVCCHSLALARSGAQQTPSRGVKASGVGRGLEVESIVCINCMTNSTLASSIDSLALLASQHCPRASKPQLPTVAVSTWIKFLSSPRAHWSTCHLRWVVGLGSFRAISMSGGGVLTVSMCFPKLFISKAALLPSTPLLPFIKL